MPWGRLRGDGMSASRCGVLSVLLLGGSASAIGQEGDPTRRPYETLREGYRKQDATLAASAYAEDAQYAELYDGAPPRLLRGRAQIAQSFEELFESLGGTKDSAPDLNFRLTGRESANAADTQVGIYRLTTGAGLSRQNSYGRFATQIRAGLFHFDVSTNATEEDFETAPGPVLLNPDDETLSSYYDAFLGGYAGSDGCTEIITRSTVRLFSRNTCTQAWRGLTRFSGPQWQAGAKTIDPAPQADYAFSPSEDALSITHVAKVERLARATPYRTEDIRFTSADQSILAGTLYLPANASTRRAGVVLVHGSGPQDRHGYASIMGVLADALAREGLVVLSYDKRGVGGSTGDWASASFATLAQDATAGMQALRGRSEVDLLRVGLAGSSQAGWIVAKAIEAGANPGFTILLGAAGSALTVEEQNLYNTQTRMRCARLPEPLIAKALDQQRRFYDARRDPAKADALRTASQALAGEAGLRDWLFPATVDTQARVEWFNVLELDFDPLPVWAGYGGKAYFLFGDQDDSTPTAVAAERLARAPRVGQREVVVLPGAQHLGLVARDVCKGELTDTAAFHAELFPTLRRWAGAVGK